MKLFNYHANKATGMEIGIQCRYEILDDWLDTSLTLGCQIGDVAVFAVGGWVDLQEALVV